MKPWKKEFHTYYMMADSKPKGKMRRHIEKSVRKDGVKEIDAETREELEYSYDWQFYDDPEWTRCDGCKLQYTTMDVSAIYNVEKGECEDELLCRNCWQVRGENEKV